MYGGPHGRLGQRQLIARKRGLIPAPGLRRPALICPNYEFTRGGKLWRTNFARLDPNLFIRSTAIYTNRTAATVRAPLTGYPRWLLDFRLRMLIHVARCLSAYRVFRSLDWMTRDHHLKLSLLYLRLCAVGASTFEGAFALCVIGLFSFFFWNTCDEKVLRWTFYTIILGLCQINNGCRRVNLNSV